MSLAETADAANDYTVAGGAAARAESLDMQGLVKAYGKERGVANSGPRRLVGTKDIASTQLRAELTYVILELTRNC